MPVTSNSQLRPNDAPWRCHPPPTVMRVPRRSIQAIGPPALTQGGAKPAVKGWLTKVRVGLVGEERGGLLVRVRGARSECWAGGSPPDTQLLSPGGPSH